MKFIINNKELKDIVKNFKDNMIKTTYPCSDFFRVETNDGKLSFSYANGNEYIEHSTKTACTEDLSKFPILEIDKIDKILNTIDDTYDVHMYTKEEDEANFFVYIKWKGKRVAVKIQGIDNSNFLSPNFQGIEEIANIKIGDLTSIFNICRGYVTKGGNTPIYETIKLIMDNNSITSYAMNTTRVNGVCCVKPVASCSNTTLCVTANSKKAINNIPKDEFIKIVTNGNMFGFAKDDYIYLTKMYAGTFNDISKIFSKQYVISATIDRADFINCLTRLDAVNTSKKVYLAIANNQVILYDFNSTNTEYVDTIAKAGGDVKKVFFISDLIQAATTIVDTELHLGFVYGSQMTINTKDVSIFVSTVSENTEEPKKDDSKKKGEEDVKS